MEKVQEFDMVRLLRPYTGANLWGDEEIRSLPAGALGTAVDIHGDGVAADVEFVLQGAADEGEEFFTAELAREEFEIVENPKMMTNAF